MSKRLFKRKYYRFLRMYGWSRRNQCIDSLIRIVLKNGFLFYFGWCDYEINIFFICVFYPKYYYYYYSLSNRCERELDRSFLPFFIRHHGASPPLSEIRLKQDEYWGGHGKNGIGG
jgi:hypothetical protein